MVEPPLDEAKVLRGGLGAVGPLIRRPIASELGLRLGWADEGNFSDQTPTRRAYDLLAAGFGPGFNGPFIITAVTRVDTASTDIESLHRALAATPGVAAVTPPTPSDPAAPGAYLMTLIPDTAPQDRATTTLVRSRRADVIPAAAAGLTVHVAVFGWGWGAELLGIEGGPINPFIPLMLFAVLFGLSMDYEVFLLPRIREEYDRTGEAVASVADGLASTARVITAAVAIMVVVFGSFMFEDIRESKLFGLGLALAVLIDATIVRMVLDPATMELLGHRNWWIPRWLNRALPRLSIENHGKPAPATASTAA